VTITEQVPLFMTTSGLQMPTVSRPARHPSATLKVVDLFAGAGGLSEGFRQVGIEILGASDVDPDACATYALNFPEAVCITGDIREPAVHERVMDIAVKADIIVGGPPCQAFSQVRNHARLIDDPRNSLYREFVSIVGKVLPSVFVMENVPGLAQMGVLEQVVTDLRVEGEYNVVAQVLDAADFGVPQTRKRIVFIGVHRSLGVGAPLIEGSGATAIIDLVRLPGGYKVQTKGTAGSELIQRLLDPEDVSIVSASQAISDLRKMAAGRREDDLRLDLLPEPESAFQRAMRNGLDGPIRNVSLPRINEDTVSRLNGIPAGGNHRDLAEHLRERYLSGQKWGPSNGTGKLGRRHYYAYRRLHPDIWAWTLNTKGDSVYHYASPRALSVREFARLQSFPDHFVFTTDARLGKLPGRIDGGATHSRYRQVGNAVPPQLASAIAERVCAVVKIAVAQAHGSAE
jgi:DNA (cytosine-5)-methyltransferase 1